MTQSIKININIGELTLTKDEVEKMYFDNIFLIDSAISLMDVNGIFTESSVDDVPETVLSIAKDNGFNKDFLKEIINNYDTTRDNRG